MEDRGPLHWFLGLRVTSADGNVTLDQERYIETRLEKIQMSQCKPTRTPADLNFELLKARGDEDHVDHSDYRSLVGSLLNLAKQKWSDMMFIVNVLSRHLTAPTNQH